MEKVKISEVQIVPVKPNNGLVAFASCIFNEQLYLSSIAIFTRADGSGYRLVYPTKKVGDKNLNIFHPINSQIGEILERAIIEKFTKLIIQ